MTSAALLSRYASPRRWIAARRRRRRVENDFEDGHALADVPRLQVLLGSAPPQVERERRRTGLCRGEEGFGGLAAPAGIGEGDREIAVDRLAPLQSAAIQLGGSVEGERFGRRPRGARRMRACPSEIARGVQVTRHRFGIGAAG